MSTDKGKDYERFVYEKFRRLFADAVVTLDDRIVGKESGLERQIDISIRFTIDGTELLYVVQCKDRANRPADIIVLGEFSSVIKDVGAAKGFLVCTSGFARSNYRYALRLGIELLTVEDINSDRWKADIQVPFIYIKKMSHYQLTAGLITNEELVEKNRDQDLVFRFDIDSLITLDGGQTVMSIKEHLNSCLAEMGADAKEGVELDLYRPNLRVSIADVWVECNELSVNLTVEKTYYLKYLTPSEYSQLRDHQRDSTLPLHIVLSGPSTLDDTFIEVPGDELPIAPLVYTTFEEWDAIEYAQGKHLMPGSYPGERGPEGSVFFRVDTPEA